MKKRISIDLVAEFPRVELRFTNGTLLKSYRAVVSDGKGCTSCALFDSGICRYVDCDNVVYFPVLSKPNL